MMMSPILILLLSSLAIVRPVNCAQSAVNLRTAGNYVILAQSAISTSGATPATAITGDLGLSPAAASYITGFNLILAPGGQYSTSALVTGKVYAASYGGATATALTQAISDETTAYNDAAGRLNPDHLNFSVNGPSTLSAGLYKWTAPLALSGSITFNGNATTVYIFQISGTLTFNSNCQILLSGGQLASNIFYQVTGSVTLATNAQVQGIILGKTNIVFNSKASLVNGRALAQTAVTLISNTITAPP